MSSCPDWFLPWNRHLYELSSLTFLADFAFLVLSDYCLLDVECVRGSVMHPSRNSPKQAFTFTSFGDAACEISLANVLP